MLYAQLPQLIPGEPLPITMELAHELIWGGIEYAARYGFRPDPDLSWRNWCSTRPRRIRAPAP